jgi:osmotically inducible protein OsmC
MPVRKADAEWQGGLQDGRGTMRLGSGAFEGAYSYGTRFEDEPGTNPEELIGAAHAGCFTMALSGVLGGAGHPPQRLASSARVHLDKVEGGFGITKIELTTRGQVDGLDAEEFKRHAATAKENCPVSKALAAVEITLDADLEG